MGATPAGHVSRGVAIGRWCVDRCRHVCDHGAAVPGIRRKQPVVAVTTRDDKARDMIASVRVAKARLSELLGRAAAGEEIVITSSGRPKAKLVGIGVTAGPPFRAKRALLPHRPQKGTPAETIVRAERDARD